MSLFVHSNYVATFTKNVLLTTFRFVFFSWKGSEKSFLVQCEVIVGYNGAESVNNQPLNV